MTVIMWRPPPVEIQSLIGIRRQGGGGLWALSGMNVGGYPCHTVLNIKELMWRDSPNNVPYISIYL